MAGQLISSMAADWKPADYKDEFRQRLSDVIKKRMKANKVTSHETEEDEIPVENATTNVVDFMSLLKESLATNKRTPAKGGTVSGKKPDSPKTAATAGKSAKKTPAKKTAKAVKKTTKAASRTRSAAKTASKKSASATSRPRKNADSKKKAA